MFTFIIQNWFIILAIAVAIVIGGIAIKNFFIKDRAEQEVKVKEWLLYAVTMAEQQLGNGTGQIKLRYTYNAFVTKFPYLVKIISFERFSQLVDEALEKFKSMLATNTYLQDFVDSE